VGSSESIINLQDI